jgi:hypothetical protein
MYFGKRLMSLEENKRLVGQYFEAFEAGQAEAYDQLLGPDFYVRGLHVPRGELPAERGPEVLCACCGREELPDEPIGNPSTLTNWLRKRGICGIGRRCGNTWAPLAVPEMADRFA